MTIVSLSDFDILLYHTYINLERNMLRQTNFLSISTIYELFVIDWHVDSINQIFFGFS